MAGLLTFQMTAEFCTTFDISKIHRNKIKARNSNWLKNCLSIIILEIQDKLALSNICRLLSFSDEVGSVSQTNCNQRNKLNKVSTCVLLIFPKFRNHQKWSQNYSILSASQKNQNWITTTPSLILVSRYKQQLIT